MRTSEVTIRCRFMAESASAVQIADADDGVCHWIPTSQILRMTRNPPEKKAGTITMTEWIARQKGLT